MAISASNGVSQQSSGNQAVTAKSNDSLSDNSTSLRNDMPGGGMLQSVFEQLRNTSSPLEQGTLLRSLDNATGGRGQTALALQNALTNPTSPTALVGGSAAAPAYDASNLYGPHGPRLTDIAQGHMKDCATLGTLGALANERPSAIRDAITYDPATQNFTARLYDSSGTAQFHTVTQADITANIARGGGSRRDNGVADAPIWPDVMEVARAKQTDTNHADGLDQGYADIAAFPDDAMRFVTGTAGTTVAFSQNAGETRTAALARMGTELQAAIKSDRPVTAWIVPESGASQDGLRDNHVYTMTRAFQDSNGNWNVTLRDPWATSTNTEEGVTRDGAFTTMSIDRLERLGGLQSFQIGD